MIAYEHGLYVRIAELAKGPHPRPLSSGFNSDTAYRVLGIYSPSETAEAYLTLSNDCDELWFISNRHVRMVRLSDQNALRLPLHRLDSEQPAPGRAAQYQEHDRRIA